MTLTEVRKPFYRLSEICARWSMSEADIAAFVLEDQLVLSIAVSQVRLQMGYYEEVDTGNWCSIPTNLRRFSGTLDLLRDDAWAALSIGSCGAGYFRAPKGEFIEYMPEDESGAFHIEAASLVVRRTEIDRFEAAQSMHAAAPIVPSNEERSGSKQRGAPTKYDVDAFWRQVCRLIFHDGPPPKQGEMVRQLHGWFEESLGFGNGPDESWIRKKIAPLWPDIQPDSRPPGWGGSKPIPQLGDAQKNGGRSAR